jgi:hypothetical protein
MDVVKATVGILVVRILSKLQKIFTLLGLQTVRASHPRSGDLVSCRAVIQKWINYCITAMLLKI